MSKASLPVTNTELTDLGSVVGSTKDELGGTVVARADVRNVGLVLDQDLCASKIAELQDATARIEQKVLRFDVTMADPLRVDVRERAEELVDVDFDLKNGHCSLQLIEVAGGAVYSLGDILEDEIQVDFFFL